MSQDEWWHLKTGKWLWEHGLRPPQNDIFAYASENIRWDNHEYLAQAGMYLAWKFGEITHFGPMRAVISAKTLIWLAALLLAGWHGWRRSKILPAVLLIVLIAAAAGRRTLQPRPPVLTYLFIAIFHYALIAWKGGALKNKHLLALPALMILWANLHGGFILGGIAIALFFCGEMAEFFWFRWRRNDAALAHAALLRAAVLLGIGALTGLCSLATPFGWRLYLLPIRVMSDRELVIRIWELQSPLGWPLRLLWPYLALAAFFAIGLLLFRKRVWVGEVLWIAFLFQQSSQHLRHLPLFAIACIPACSSFLGAISGQPRIALHARYVLCLAAIGLSLWFGLNRTERPQSYFERSFELMKGHAYRTEDYPVRLADFIEDADIRGRMFNDSRYAGYLIWRLSPERMKVFTDMRYDIFGGQFMTDEMAVRLGAFPDENGRRIEWREVLDKWQADVLILDKLEGRFDDQGNQRPDWILPQLENSAEWTLVYADPVPDHGLVVFIRNTNENREMIARARSIAPQVTYQREGREAWGR